MTAAFSYLSWGQSSLITAGRVGPTRHLGSPQFWEWMAVPGTSLPVTTHHPCPFRVPDLGHWCRVMWTHVWVWRPCSTAQCTSWVPREHHGPSPPALTTALSDPRASWSSSSHCALTPTTNVNVPSSRPGKMTSGEQGRILVSDGTTISNSSNHRHDPSISLKGLSSTALSLLLTKKKGAHRRR